MVGLYVPILSMAQKDDREYRSFATQKMLKINQKEDPDFQKKEIEREKQISNYVKGGTNKDFTLPIIFHVISNPSQKVPDEVQISAQVDKINAVFSNIVNNEFPKDNLPNDIVGSYYEKGVETQIQFCNPQNILGLGGIRYYETKNEFWDINNDMKNLEKGGIEAVDPKHYINIWVVALKDNSAGFAQMPGVGLPQNDGIVIDFSFLGDAEGTAIENYQGGKTLAHLLGNYLGLFELWDDDNTCKDDKVQDTPTHNAPNYNVITEPNHQHFSMCPDEFLAMYMNIMDNSDDDLLTLFTEGQKNRMQAVLSEKGSRGILGNGEVSCKKPREQEEKIVKNNSIGLYPNPATNIVNLNILCSKGGAADIFIVNALGKTIYSKQLELIKGNQVFTLESDTWTAGIYFVKVQFDDKTSLLKTLTINN